MSQRRVSPFADGVIDVSVIMKRIFYLLVAFLLIACGHSAKADAIYTLNYDSCTGGCGTNGQGTSNNNFGYVTLHQVNASTVSVTVSLAAGVGLGTDFVNTGNGYNHEPFAFNVDKSVTVSNISNSTYFTVGPKETRAWTIHRGTKAPAAAGVIHTDFEKGFIRAETIAYADYVALGGEAGARDAGKLRLEGKEYVVADGDVLHFRFNN